MYNFIVSWYYPDSGVYITKTVNLDNQTIIDMAMDQMEDTPMWSIVHPLVATVGH